MNVTLMILVSAVAVSAGANWYLGGRSRPFVGLQQAARLFRAIWLRLVLGFALGGFVKVLLPGTLVVQWLGPAAGWKGIMIAAATGTLIGGGGPYVIMPILASLVAAGADVGPVIALLSAWTLTGLQELIVWQIPFLGVRLAVARYVASLAAPPVVGFLGSFIYRLLPPF
ncbi:MAG: hypothetical protein ABID87_03740 [Chloroflexota bacterium]